jgi:hypothetical protein
VLPIAVKNKTCSDKDERLAFSAGREVIDRKGYEEQYDELNADKRHALNPLRELFGLSKRFFHDNPAALNKPPGSWTSLPEPLQGVNGSDEDAPKDL